MRHLPPIPWHLVRPGTVVLYGIPRAVHVNDSWGAQRTVMLEGIPAIYPRATDLVQPVELDDTDAIGNMLRAGLTLTPIKE